MRYQHFYTKALSFIILGYDWIILIRLHQITRGLFPNSQKLSGKRERLSWYLMRRNQVTSLLSQLSRPSTLPATRLQIFWMNWSTVSWAFSSVQVKVTKLRLLHWNKFHFKMCRISGYSRASPVVLCYNLIDQLIISSASYLLFFFFQPYMP